MTISREELLKVRYLDHAEIGDRVLNLLPLWDGSKWQLWLPVEDKLVEVATAGLSAGEYVAREKELSTDIAIPVLEFFWQRVCWPETMPLINALSDDFQNLATSFAKLRHFHKHRLEIGDILISKFAVTEIEYLLVVSRSVFDLVHEIIAKVWNGRVQLINIEMEAKRKKKPLPFKLSRAILHEGQRARTVEELQNEFVLPLPLAKEYSRFAGFFLQIREYRDQPVHGLKSQPMVFSTERGFCVLSREYPFRDFNGWTESHSYNENLKSILPWIRNIVTQTVEACDGLAVALSEQVLLPEPMAPAHQIITRTPKGLDLSDILPLGIERSFWWDEN